MTYRQICSPEWVLLSRDGRRRRLYRSSLALLLLLKLHLRGRRALRSRLCPFPSFGRQSHTKAQSIEGI